MNDRIFLVKLGNKRIVFLRTHTGRFYDITECQPVTDNRFGINFNGVFTNAKRVAAEYVADLLTEYESDYKQFRLSTNKGKAKASKIRKYRKEEVEVT